MHVLRRMGTRAHTGDAAAPDPPLPSSQCPSSKNSVLIHTPRTQGQAAKATLMPAPELVFRKGKNKAKSPSARYSEG